MIKGSIVSVIFVIDSGDDGAGKFVVDSGDVGAGDVECCCVLRIHCCRMSWIC